MRTLTGISSDAQMAVNKTKPGQCNWNGKYNKWDIKIVQIIVYFELFKTWLYSPPTPTVCYLSLYLTQYQKPTMKTQGHHKIKEALT